MNARRFELPVEVIGRDVSTPWPWAVSAVAPALVACPICNGGGTPKRRAAIRELVYMLAYQQAGCGGSTVLRFISMPVCLPRN